MKRVLAIFLTLFLCGCLDDQKQKMMQCELNAAKEFPSAGYREQYLVNSSIFTCMKINGYEFRMTSKKCVNLNLESSNIHRINHNPYCYKPISWAERAIYEIEIWISR